MLGGICRERRQRFVLGDDREPVRDGRSAPCPPALDGKGELRPEQQQRRNRREDLVVPRAQDLDQPREPANLLAGRMPRRMQPGPERDEERAFDRLALEPLDQRRQHAELLLALLDAVRHVMRRVPKAKASSALDDERRHEPGPAARPVQIH